MLGCGLSEQGARSRPSPTHPRGTSWVGAGGGGVGGSGKHTNLPQLPVVDQLGPVSVDQGTEAEAVLPAAQGRGGGGWPEGEWGQALRAKCQAGISFFPKMNPQLPGAGVGRTQEGKEPASCHNPRHLVKAPWGSASCHVPSKPPTEAWGPRLLCFRAPGWNSLDTLLRGLQEHPPRMYQARTERASKGEAPFPEKQLLPQGSVF